MREFSLWRDNIPTRTTVLFVVPWERSYLNTFAQSAVNGDSVEAEEYAATRAADDKRLPWDVRLRLHLAEVDYSRMCGEKEN